MCGGGGAQVPARRAQGEVHLQVPLQRGRGAAAGQPQQPPQPPTDILQPSVTVSLASTPYVGKEEVISAGNQIVPQPQQPQQPLQQPSVIVTPTVVPVVNNGNGMKIETMNKVEVTPILEDLGVSGPKKAKLGQD